MNIIKNDRGIILGRIEDQGDKRVVKDPFGKVLGWTCSTGTYDYTGSKISEDRVEGLLL